MLMKSSQNKIVNLGSGGARIAGADNVDSADNIEADIKLDLKSYPWDIIPSDRYQTAYFFHCIEHIEKKYWLRVLDEIWRILEPGGLLVISYPEFEKVAQNWINNYQGKRDFWEKTIFGRQAWEGDYHVSAVWTPELIEKMLSIGFTIEKSYPEPNQPFNTVIKAHKGPRPPSYEDVLNREVLGRE